ncbi:hypothetical protein [Acinetobacter phage P577]|uniref:hypothetical protein n=1 Tax=Acinetobacter phage YMC13/03/R2096 TaxID=1560342 RepID=UPI00052A8F5E|nr:hypothetical protein ACQ36_gp077 [Acinetobacter phage YMC13/03/R2096]AIW02856.1 hypothetical protein BPABA577_01220 [Acinetobacter phage YMC13/03/R2096]WNT46180.1 hypothetical protein [Acinetobacter phage P577]
MGYYKVGDVVEITKLIALDEELGIKVGDIAKVQRVKDYDDGDQYIICYNPKWNRLIDGLRRMVPRQLKKVK